MSTSSSSQKAVNYLERRADFSALDAVVSKRRGLDALRMNADVVWPSLAPIKVNGKQYSSSYCISGPSSAVASAGTLSYSSGRGQASKYDPDWFRIGSSPKSSGSTSSKTKKKSQSKNKDSAASRDKKKSQSTDRELSARGNKLKSPTKDERIQMHPDKEMPTSNHGNISSGSNEAILKHSEAAVRRRLERKVSRDRETRSVRKARLRSMVRSMQFSSTENFDPDLLEHTDDEERIYHYPYRTNTDSPFEITNPPTSRTRRHPAIPHTTQPTTQHRQTNAQSGTRSVVRVKSGRTNYRSCKRSLLRWMAHAMCKQPHAKHY